MKINRTYCFVLVGLALFLIWKAFVYVPTYAKQYSASPSFCSYQEKTCTNIGFSFSSSQKAKSKIPRYEVRESREQGETKIIFYNTFGTGKQFAYDQVINNPLIAKLDYGQEGKNFVVKILRKGAFLPAEILQSQALAVIVLKEGDENFPVISDQLPSDNSAAWPALRTIRFKVALKTPLKQASVFFQGEKIEASGVESAPNQYSFSFQANVEKDKEYTVKTMITDEQNRTSISIWTFEGQVLAEITLGKDRFKYFGWWGDVNTNYISVREGPSTLSKKLGTLSSINRVKVLKEVYGEVVNDNSVWYQIDGGQFPGAYVFSEYVTPAAQPEPPAIFAIPENVNEGDYWIDVDLTKKIITLFDYDEPLFASYVSIGREKNPTPDGTYRVWYKLRKAGMKGGPPLHDYVYDLKDIPWIMYYNESYAIHGTYWHDRFGAPQSAGCTNLTQGDAAFIFEKTGPNLKPEQQEIFSTRSNPGIVVYNHF
ncbi:MAG: L,D-transpeptidase family protein [Candidatus Pacebacteria bacterium]|nr:L,D-transpeptidase family protein [Candidatus Paceibacterota bacterium]